MNSDLAFPLFDDEQMGHAEALGSRCEYQPGDLLIRPGQKNYPFFVFESGEVEILEMDGSKSTLIATHGPRAFSGDVDMLTGRSSLFAARAKTKVVAYSLPGEQIRRLLSACPRFGEMLVGAFQTRRAHLEHLPFVGVRVVGRTNAANTSQLREFLYKNHVPHTFYESNSSDGEKELAQLNAESLELPVVRCNGVTFSNPSLLQLAQCLGIHETVDGDEFDLAIVGCGPSGLAAAVYAASEGIKVLVIDRVGPGGQAGSSSKIENFIGFPSGLSGSDLANRGYLQALKFGAKFISPETVEEMEATEEGQHCLRLSSGQAVQARCVLIASGVSYRQLGLEGCEQFEGAGVYYAATSVEARICENKEAVVVGGGNSAGQAAMFLAESAERVHLLIRGDNLGKSMSAYLCERVQTHPKIVVHHHREVAEVCGTDALESIRIKNNQSQEVSELSCAGLFIFVGAKPHTGWLPSDILLDEKGFVLTGSSIFAAPENRPSWPLERLPCDLETTRPGVMASGDVRSGTTKRCGFAVGDGSLAVACVHRYLNDLS